MVGQDVHHVEHDPALDEEELGGAGEEAVLVQQRGNLGDVQVVSGGEGSGE